MNARYPLITSVYIAGIKRNLKDIYYTLRYHITYNLSVNNGNKLRKTFLYIFHTFTFYFLFSTITSCFYYMITVIRNSKKNYVHFDNHMFLISPFYWVRAINIKRHGTKGTSRTMSLGQCDLKQFWSYNPLSFFSYWKFGTNFLILSSLLFIISFSAWFTTKSSLSVLFVFLIFLTTKNFHYFTFVSQNYNAIGWAITPLYAFGIFNDNLIFSVTALFLTTILSFTVSVVLILISIPLSFETGNPHMTLLVAPALASLLIQIIFRIGTHNVLEYFTTVLKSIGAFSRNKTKYIRTGTPASIYLPNIILLLLFSYSLYIYNSFLSFTIFTIILIILVNFKIIRFLDNQSIDILIFLYTTSVLLEHELNNAFTLIVYCALNYFLFFRITSDKFIKEPISHDSLKESLCNFLSSVPSHSKIFFKFNNPNDCYDKCFGNQRFLIDYPVYYATERYIRLFPDFSAVFDNNHPDSPSLWANSVSETISQLNNHKTQYCIVSQERNSRLDKAWQNNGFSLISEFCWLKYLTFNKLNLDQWYYGKPKWFLLKYNHLAKPT